MGRSASAIAASLAACLLLHCWLTAGAVQGEAASAEPKPSQYAPAENLTAQLDYYIERLGKALANEASYGETQQKQVAQEAATLAVIAQLLGMHDADHSLKPAAPAMIAAAQELAGHSDDFAAALAALDKFKVARTVKDEPVETKENEAEPLDWEPVGDVVMLMRQVPIVNNNMRRAVTSRRFEREVEQAAEHSATLAAIAQSTMHDPNYYYDEETEAAWKRISAAMRDAAGQINAAVRQGDQKAAQAALDVVVKQCDACHADFR